MALATQLWLATVGSDRGKQTKQQRFKTAATATHGIVCLCNLANFIPNARLMGMLSSSSLRNARFTIMVQTVNCISNDFTRKKEKIQSASSTRTQCGAHDPPSRVDLCQSSCQDWLEFTDAAPQHKFHTCVIDGNAGHQYAETGLTVLVYQVGLHDLVNAVCPPLTIDAALTAFSIHA